MDRDPRSWGGGGGVGEAVPNATLSPPERVCIKMGSVVSRFGLSLIVVGQDVVYNHNFSKTKNIF